VTECVPETYQATRTAYRTECRQETFTAYRTECAPETRTRVCTFYKQVPEVQTLTRNYWVCVPTVEERVVMERVVTYKPVTHMVCKCVDRGHWECCEVPCKECCLKRMFKKLCHKKDCCDECPPTKIVKVWVPCPVYEYCPVTTCQKVCEYRPVTCKVTVLKRELRQEQCQVTCWKCVPEQRTETYQVLVPRLVPYQATRSVAVCVPYQETVTLTRTVSRVVAKQVPVEACAPTCCPPKCHHRCAGLCCRHHCGCE
jgi:hypothetical protein